MPTRPRRPRSTAKARRAAAGDMRKAGVIGLGYVGLPLLVEFARAGFEAVGFDVDPRRRRQIARGDSPVEDVPSADLRGLVRQGKITIADDWSALRHLDAMSICVPTPLRKSKEPDISYIRDAAETLAPHLRAGQLIILESTTYPGTTREVVLPILEATGLRVGRDFWLAFSPERVDPGNREWPLTRIPKVVGGVTPACTERAAAFYGRVFETVHPVSGAEAAEMAKLLENTFRAVNIGLVNEFALACHRLGLDTWEIIGAAATKPFGFMPFRPGPGLGGHCIPIDPMYLSWRMRLLNFSTRFIDLAEEVNSAMPEHVVERLAALLNERGKALSRSKILLLGVAYKANVSDTRESPALDILALLEGRRAHVSYHDPLVASVRSGDKTYRSVPLTTARLRSCDAAVILTPHREIDLAAVCRHAPLVFDTRGVISGKRTRNVVNL
jgi:UDP-N-acetyl-D-glucosamine dehydrogenase